MVKATTRELSFIILVGCILCFCSTYVIIAKPVIWTCYLGRIIPGVAFAMIYGALVTKTNRIARILAGSKKKIMTKKPRFMSATAQVRTNSALVKIGKLTAQVRTNSAQVKIGKLTARVSIGNL